MTRVVGVDVHDREPGTERCRAFERARVAQRAHVISHVNDLDIEKLDARVVERPTDVARRVRIVGHRVPRFTRQANRNQTKADGLKTGRVRGAHERSRRQVEERRVGEGDQHVSDP